MAGEKIENVKESDFDELEKVLDGLNYSDEEKEGVIEILALMDTEGFENDEALKQFKQDLEN
jgi:hypothetical protein